MIILLLKHFIDVLKASLRGKNFTYRIVCDEKVPDASLKLWKSRRYNPAAIGVAYVKFEGKTKEFLYPAFFWE